MLLVMADRELGASAPFKVEPTDELSAVVIWSGDKLRLDLSKSRKQFCFPLSEFDLDWNRLEFTKVKKN
ncbi:MAG TPA: hypothetical protein VHR72_06040 [Gemmataceae bacterium]|nr:hypothetical protein [Gemmataceae bacterium]